MLNFRNRPNQKILTECRDEEFQFRFYSQMAEHSINFNEIQSIDSEKLIYKYDGQDITIETNKIGEIQTLPKTKVVNIFLQIDQKSQYKPLILPVLIGIIITVIGGFYENEFIIGWGLASILSVYIGFFYSIFFQHKNYKQKILRAVDSSRINTLITNLDKSTTEEDYFNKLIAVNLKYMDDYYHLVQIQTSKSYQLTRFGAIVGFLVLLIGIGLSYYTDIKSGNDNLLSTGGLTMASGIIIEFISAIFFYLYNKTIQQLNIYHDKLIAVQDTTLALKVAQSITDVDMKNQTMRYLTRILTNKLIKTPEAVNEDNREGFKE